MSGSTTIVNQNAKVSSLFTAFDALGDPTVSEFTSSIPEDFPELVSRLYADNTIISDFVLQNRSKLKSVVKGIHEEAGTLTQPVAESIMALDDPTTKLVVSTHQPNLFAYGGVLKKIVLLENLQRSSRSLSHSRTVNLFLIVDHDFLDENWIRIAQLPSVNHSSGIMELRMLVSESRKWQLVCNTPVPSKTILNHWKHQIKSWIKCCTASRPHKRIEANANFEELWNDVVLPAYSRSRSYADLNSFMMSALVNRVWGYGTLFVRLSQLSRLFENGFTFLLENFGIYSEALRGIESRLMSKGIDTGISSSTFRSAPVWLHCACGSKASVKVVRTGGMMRLEGPCMSCKKYLERDLGRLDDLDLSTSAADLSPRAIPIPLLLSRDLGVSCYCSGTGGIGYLVDSSVIARKLALRFPIVAVWASKDSYLGIGHSPPLSEGERIEDNFESELSSLKQASDACHRRMAPLLARRRSITKDGGSMDELLSELFAIKQQQRSIRQMISSRTKAQNISRLAPCFVDYAVNFGLDKTERVWTSHLLQDGRLAATIKF
jgi:hypothetical protein